MDLADLIALSLAVILQPFGGQIMHVNSPNIPRHSRSPSCAIRSVLWPAGSFPAGIAFFIFFDGKLHHSGGATHDHQPHGQFPHMGKAHPMGCLNAPGSTDPRQYACC